VASGLTDPVATPFSSQPSASAGELLTVCEHGGKALAVRGTLEAYDAPSGAVSLSILPLEEYVRSVVSGEVSWSWGLFGGTAGSPQGEPWGFQALEAQAVATRSYVAAELAAGGWKPYATTCDVYCQSYPGISGEASDIDAAVADTVGEILAEPVAAQNPSGRHSGEFVQPAPGGPGPSSPGQPSSQYAPVLAEYSASTGGYTGGGAFPDVIDSGDSICIKSHYYSCNPCHKWVAVVPVTAIEKAFKSAGKLASIDITGRNGLGALGGRVETLVITGTSGTELSVPSWSLEPLLAAANPDHCASDWYGVSNGP
jgi:hypothetical protein